VGRAQDFLAARGLDVELLGTLDLAGWQSSAAPSDLVQGVSQGVSQRVPNVA
jgi:D-methionine transport system ATP-binding protein